jgi:hypothetical protein
LGAGGVCETPANTSTSARAATTRMVFFIGFLLQAGVSDARKQS